MSTWRPLDPGGSEPRPLSESLDRLTRRLGAPASSVFSAVFANWEALVGPDIAAHSRPVSLKRGILVLSVDHSAWAAQLRYLTTQLLARIGEATGGSEVVEIQLRVAGPDVPRRPGNRPVST